MEQCIPSSPTLSDTSTPSGPPSPTSPPECLSAPRATRQPSPFRVIIVGAGVGGLVLSHALTRAGVDHVVLEKGVVAPEWGASISIWAHGARILSQIGCWEALEAASVPLQKIYVRGPDGQAYSEEPYFDMMLERNGFNYLTMERRDFLRIIHEQHPDKARILTGKRVVDYDEDEGGVTVKLSDGTEEKGDILIGCDGVHSTIRDLMWKRANTAIPGYISAKEKTSLVTTYRSLVGVAKPLPGVDTRNMHWVTHPGLSFLILTQPDKTFFFVNWKLPQKIPWPHKAKWSDAEAEEAAASVADLSITDTAVFGELWKNRTRAHLIGLQEGVFDHWHFGRVVLAGDNVHKVTPNLALGAMCALESTAVLLNELHPVITRSGGTKPSTATLTHLFARYEAKRKPRQHAASRASAELTRLHAWDGVWRRLVMRYGLPLLGQVRIAEYMADMAARAPKIDFLPMPAYPMVGTYAWEEEEEEEEEEEPNYLIQLGAASSKKPGRLSTCWTTRSGCTVEMFALVLLFLLLQFFFQTTKSSLVCIVPVATGNRSVGDGLFLGL